MTEFVYEEIKADTSITDFVKRFWKFSNPTADKQLYTILPDGFFDIIIKIKANKLDCISLIGLCTREIETTIPADTTILGICFKPLATEYILHQKIADILNTKQNLPTDFWNIDKIPFDNFNNWATEITSRIVKTLKSGKPIDNRKQNLFNILFKTNGSLTVQEISNQLFWNSRQINRYFKTNFGLSLKSYSNVLRCKATYSNIKKGDLFPTDNFADQPHFIKEIKKHTGTTPKVLAKNKNDRFIQFSTRPT
jgi:AraC-like DNA-binding protein